MREVRNNLFNAVLALLLASSRAHVDGSVFLLGRTNSEDVAEVGELGVAHLALELLRVVDAALHHEPLSNKLVGNLLCIPAGRGGGGGGGGGQWWWWW